MDDKDKRESIFETHRENIYFRWGITAFAVIVACILASQVITKLPALLAVVKRFFKTLAPVLYGLVIAYLLHPIVDRVEKALSPQLQKKIRQESRATGIARGIGIFAALLLAALVLWALISMILPGLVDSIATIVRNSQSYYNTLSRWVTNLIDDNPVFANMTEGLMDEIYDYLINFLKNSVLPGLQTVLATLTTSVVGMARQLLNLIIGVIISVYLLSGKKKLLSQMKKLLYGFLGVKKGGAVCNVCTYANRMFGGFIGGKLMDSLIIGILCFLGLSVLNMPYTMLISVIVGVTNIIPFFGPYLGAIPSALLLLVISPIQCLYFIIFILILQQIDGNIIGPMILGDATGLDSIWVVVSILIFGSFWGIVGMVVAVPLFAVLYKLLSETVNRLLVSRGLSTDRADYQKWNYPPRTNLERWNAPLRRKKGKKRFGQRKKSGSEQQPKKPAEPSQEETEETES